MITIVDYGLGNVRAFANIFKNLERPCTIAADAAALTRASKLILPGVGAGDRAMQLLDRSGLRPTLEEKVRSRGVPVLGVCVGMQILADASDEGTRPGLGWIPGRVRKFPTRGQRLPHMGWNLVDARKGERLFSGVAAESRFYFLHSYVFECRDESDSAARAVYGAPFAAAVRRDNVYGVQFHPEKSHADGIRLLENFAEL